jgi:2-C-methyl-D-erythritol 4-phosphate cytidylyltransferase
MTAPRHFALIPAAGVGIRLGADCPKQYLRLAGKQILLHVLDTFAAAPAIAHTYLVVSAGDEYVGETLANASRRTAGRVTVVYEGGDTRQQSVLNGLNAMRKDVADDDWVLVHDAARPGLTVALIDKLVQALDNDEVGGLLALPVVDTLKRGDAEGRVATTVSRDLLWAAQTPQMFRYALLCRALQNALAVTDEAGAVEMLGLKPKLVEGSPRNFKLTLPHDLALAELYLKGNP